MATKTKKKKTVRTKRTDWITGSEQNYRPEFHGALKSLKKQLKKG